MQQILATACLLLSVACVTASCSHYHSYGLPPEPLTASEIIRRSREGESPDEIVREIRAHRTVYLMDAKDVVRLHERGVDDKVIDYMLETRLRDVERRARHEGCWHGSWHGCWHECWASCCHDCWYDPWRPPERCCFH